MTAMRRKAITTTVRLKAYEVLADVGINPDEANRTQPLIVAVEAEVLSGRIEGIEDTIDYRAIVAEIEDLARGHIPLIETFGALLAQRCLARSNVQRVRVDIDKPFALARGMAGVSIEMVGQSAADPASSETLARIFEGQA